MSSLGLVGEMLKAPGGVRPEGISTSWKELVLTDENLIGFVNSKVSSWLTKTSVSPHSIWVVGFVPEAAQPREQRTMDIEFPPPPPPPPPDPQETTARAAERPRTGPSTEASRAFMRSWGRDSPAMS